MDFWPATERNNDTLTDILTYISQLSLDDIDTLQSRVQSNDPTLSDEELAMALFAEEAAGLLNVAKEHVGQSTRESRSIVEELEEMEAAARYDRIVALAISEGHPIPPRPLLPLRRAVSESDSDDSSGVLDFSTSDSESDTDASSITLVSRAPSSLSIRERDKFLVEEEALVPVASSSRPTSPLPLLEDSVPEDVPPKDAMDIAKAAVQDCAICCEGIDGPVYAAPCGHTFDSTCLEAMFRKASIDESLFPPKCCQLAIPPDEARERLDTELMLLFDRKALEFSTANKLYCSQPRCSAFIGPATDGASWLECPECSVMTCGYCKSAAHPGAACSDTDDLNNMAKTMREKEGWQRCFSCHHMVELSVGCYHIICACKAQFCYLCGAKWKECDCPQFAVPPDIF